MSQAARRIRAAVALAVMAPLHADEPPHTDPPPPPPKVGGGQLADPRGEAAAKPGATAPSEPAPVEDLGEGRFRVGLVRFDSKSRLITVPATMHMREGPVEYVLVTSQGKIHEAVFTSPINPRDLHVAALLLGMKPQPDLGPDRAAAKAGEPGALKAWVEWDRNGPPAKLPLHEVVAVANPSGAAVAGTLAAGAWLYNGSITPAGGAFAASRSGSIISVIRDPDALINYRGPSRDNDEIHTPHAARLPKTGHPVRIILKVP